MAELSTDKKEKCLALMSGIEPWTPKLQNQCPIHPATEPKIIYQDYSLNGWYKTVKVLTIIINYFHFTIILEK